MTRRSQILRTITPVNPGSHINGNSTQAKISFSSMLISFIKVTVSAKNMDQSRVSYNIG